MHVHLDPVGGIAGDMFIAAILDCRPDLESGLEDVLTALRLENTPRIGRHAYDNGVLTGSQFHVDAPNRTGHHHTQFRTIRSMLNASGLASGVRSRAMDIFEHLARAEAEVHGHEIDDVTFHEVGALDSIVDIVIAAHLIEKLNANQWSVAPIPIGSGRISSQHGTLPIPAPATLLLLENLTVFDDGVKGERITPTGAAILRHLAPTGTGPVEQMRLNSSGTGFGTLELPDIPNILRVMLLEQPIEWTVDQVTVFTFEIDDQTPEDLAIGLDNLRNLAGVLEVNVTQVSTKKGRQANRVQVLGEPNAEDAVFDCCFAQTTTLGVRYQRTRRRILNREQKQVGPVGVKIVRRPSGITAKAEMQDLAKHNETEFARTSAGHIAVSQAIHDRKSGAME